MRTSARARNRLPHRPAERQMVTPPPDHTQVRLTGIQSHQSVEVGASPILLDTPPPLRHNTPSGCFIFISPKEDPCSSLALRPISFPLSLSNPAPSAPCRRFSPSSLPPPTA